MIKDLPPGKVKVATSAAPMDKNGYFCTATAPLYFHEPAQMENTMVILKKRLKNLFYFKMEKDGSVGYPRNQL